MSVPVYVFEQRGSVYDDYHGITGVKYLFSRMNSPTAALFINERKLRIRLNYSFRTKNENISVLVVFYWGRGTVSEILSHKDLSKDVVKVW